MARVCVFDVNETLLDLGALDPHFERAFGAAGVRRAWFLQLLQSALVATVTGAYSDFGQVGAAALQMVAEREGVDLSDEDRQRILGGMRELPPHPESCETTEQLVELVKIGVRNRRIDHRIGVVVEQFKDVVAAPV